MSDHIEVSPDLMAGFLDEAPEYLRMLEEGLLAFDEQVADGPVGLRTPQDQERMNEMFRAAHSLKGVSASLGFKKIRDLTHIMESLFDQLRYGKRELDAPSVEILLKVLDTLRALVQEFVTPPDQPVAIQEQLALLESIMNSTPTPSSAPADQTAAPTPVAPQQPTVRPSVCPEDPDLLRRFIESTLETIDELSTSLLKLEEAPTDADLINAIFRCAHNIKGASGAVGATGMHRLTHDMESVLDRIRIGQLELNERLISTLLTAVDQLRGDLTQISDGGTEAISFEDAQRTFTDWISGVAPTDTSDAPTAAKTNVSADAEAAGATIVGVDFPPESSDAAIEACIIYNRIGELGRVLKSVPDVNALTAEMKVTHIDYWLITDNDPDKIAKVVQDYAVLAVQVSHATPGPATVAPVATTSAKPTAPTASQPRDAAPKAAPPPSTDADQGDGKSAAGAPAMQKAGETLRVDLERLDQLMNLSGELVITKARFVQIERRFAPLFSRGNLGYLVEDIGDRLQRVRDDVAKVPATGPQAAVVSDLSDAMLHLGHDFETVKTLVRELQHAKSAMQAFSEAVHTLNRTAEGIQKRIMQTRMVSIGPLFQRFRRVIRDICKATNKKVDLVLHGEATELDKRMIDELVDPLTHMVRNSVDHGIESREARIKDGKAEAGRVELDAFHRGRHICIQIRDDGKGVNVEAIRRKIVERELASQAQVDAMPDTEAIQYIFKPGFSTAEKVTDLSGRGMGMDIVKTKIENINGTVTVESNAGQGTVVTIHLPLTLAIINALIARIGACTYAVPMEMVTEIITVPRSSLTFIQRKPVIRVRDRVIPVTLFEQVYGVTLEQLQTRTRAASDITIMILGFQNERLGLVVDELIGQEDCVIKDIASNYRNVPGVAGASIMGDGSVSLILDVSAMMTTHAQGGVAKVDHWELPSEAATV
ncbi:MAG: Hpt domain-containing protein [Phycisphaerae bacterium]